MRARTFLLLFLVLLLIAAGVVAFLVLSGDDILGALLGGGAADTPAQVTPESAEPGQPRPTATPEFNFVPVLVASMPLPVGTQIESGFVRVEMRPDDNVAVRAGYIFSDPEDVVGRITRTRVDEGQEILDSMLALSTVDLASMGSDLALYVNQGNVAIAFPVNRYSGAAFALRPGDAVDVLATVGAIDVDPDFKTALPNFYQPVSQSALQDGGNFLLDRGVAGRLELIPGINLVATISPRGAIGWDGSTLLQIPRRVTQLTVQQAEVLWLGTWVDPGNLNPAEVEAAAGGGPPAAPAGQAPAPVPTPTPLFQRAEQFPDVVILSLSLQDALTLKWAMDRGVRMDLALRAQGDTSDHSTVSISLPQLVEQGGLTIPEPLEFDLIPRADEVEPVTLPDTP
jgi:Flp pilus assembly protein CpaB